MARPTKLTAAVEKAILDALRVGATRTAAFEAAGVSRSKISVWMARFESFRDAVTRAEADAEIRATITIRQAYDAGDWRAAVEWLKRRRPAEWSETQRVEIVNSVREMARQAGASPEEEAAAVAEAERVLAEVRRAR